MEKKTYYADTATTAFEMLEPLPKHSWHGDSWFERHASQHRLPVIGMTLKQGQVYEEGKDVVVRYQVYRWDGWTDCNKEEYKAKHPTRRRIVLVPAVQRDLDTSDNKTEGSSLASRSCTEGNSVEQIPDGENDWEYGADRYTRIEVARMLYTQRAMIVNDLKIACWDELPKTAKDIVLNPRKPEY